MDTARKWPALLLVVVVALAAAAIALVATRGRDDHVTLGKRPTTTAANDVTTWAPPGTPPLSDRRAAALVVREPESRPGNAAANDYLPTDAQLSTFRSARNTSGQTPVQFSPLLAHVTGRPGLPHPSTDDLIQWVSHKWGIPTDLIRAQVAYESGWHQSQLGDKQTVTPAWYERYPSFSRVAGTNAVYTSLGIAQVKWTPDGTIGNGTEPLRWMSTAFNLDYYAAMLRYYYDGDCSWCSPGYHAGQPWLSVAGWYEPEPWNNKYAAHYIAAVQRHLIERPWTQPGF